MPWIFRHPCPGDFTDRRGLIAAGVLGKYDIHYGEMINYHNYRNITLKKATLLISLVRLFWERTWYLMLRWQEKPPGSCWGPSGFLDRQEYSPGLAGCSGLQLLRTMAQAQPLVIIGNNEWGHYHVGQTGWASHETISASLDSELQRPWGAWGAISSEWLENVNCQIPAFVRKSRWK